jgi:hypothetical protein
MLNRLSINRAASMARISLQLGSREACLADGRLLAAKCNFKEQGHEEWSKVYELRG